MNEVVDPVGDSLDSHQSLHDLMDANLFSALSYKDAHREFKRIEKCFLNIFGLKPGTLDYTKYHSALSHYLRNGSHYIMMVDPTDQVATDQISANYSLLLDTMQTLQQFSAKKKITFLVKVLSAHADPGTHEEKFSNDYNYIHVMHEIAEHVSQLAR